MSNLQTSSLPLVKNGLRFEYAWPWIGRFWRLSAFCLLATATATMTAQSGDFTYTSNNVAITITGYTGSGGEVTIPDTIEGMPVVTIGYAAFAGAALTSAVIPDGVTSIGKAAFYGCYSLTNVIIPDSVTAIKDSAFSDCRALASIAIPAGVTVIEGDVFLRCISLTNIEVASANPAYKSVGGVLFNKTGTELVCYPVGRTGSYHVPDGVATIGFHAVFYCSGLTDVTIPDSVTNIGYGAFAACTALTGIIIPDRVTSIGDCAFANCTALTNMVIPFGVTSIGEDTFYSCPNLTSVTLPDSVTAIGRMAFSQCNSLRTIVFPASVANIGDAVFSGYLIGAYFRGNAPVVGSRPFGYGATTVYRSANATGWPSVGNDWADCRTALWDPVYLLNVANGAGSGSYTNGAVITIIASNAPSGYVFNRWTGATQYVGNVLAPSTTVTMPAKDIAVSATYATHFTYATDNGAITITGYNGPNRDITIPSVINGLPVTAIGYAAFDWTALTSVVIPEGIISVGKCAFYGCRSLTNIVIPNSVTTIKDSAFSDCSALTSITIPSGVTLIEGDVFLRCISLTNIEVASGNPAYSSVDGVLFNKTRTALVCYPAGKTGSYHIPDGVATIGLHAVFYCSGLTDVTIPDSVTNIGYGAFGACTALKGIIIPDRVTSIGDCAIANCTALTNMVIPFGVTSIGEDTFYNCASLTGITIPDSVTTFGRMAFYQCTSLTNIVISAGVTNIGDEAFGGCTSLTAITVDPLNLNYVSVDGVLYNKSKTAVIQYPAGKKESGIAVSVTSIEKNAFFGCPSLTNIAISESVTNIGDGAFGDCPRLTAITVDVLNPSYASVDGVLFNKSKTDLVQYPAGKEGSCNISNGVSCVRDFAFVGCSGLTNITLNSFGGGSVSPSPANPAGDKRERMGISYLALQGDESSGVDPSNQVNIGNNAFDCCTNLVSVTFGSGVTNIGNNAFIGCANLTSVYFEGNAPSVGTNVFAGVDHATIYYLDWTTGWSNPWADRPAVVWLRDLDADGMPDSWERQYFGGLTNGNPDAVCSNGINTVMQAYIAGLDPNDPQSVFLVSVSSNGKVISWDAVSGRVYTVYWTTNLLNGFEALGTNILWPQNSFTNLTTVPCGFYKISVRLQ